MKLSPQQLKALDFIATGRIYPVLTREDDGWHARWKAYEDSPSRQATESGVEWWVDEFVRNAASTTLSENAEDRSYETLHDAWIMALKSNTGLVRWNDAECDAFAGQLRRWSDNARVDADARKRIVFKFDSSSTDCAITCEAAPTRRILKQLGEAVSIFPPLAGLSAGSGRGLSVSLSRQQAESFVRNGARMLKEAGYGVEGVDISAGITVCAEVFGESGGEESNSHAQVKLQIKIAGQVVTADEVRFLLEQGSSMVVFRDHWIEIDRSILRQALRILERRERKVPSALGFVMGIGRIDSLEVNELKVHGWLRGLVNNLKQAGRIKDEVGDGSQLSLAGLNGELRGYQRRGVEWIRFLTSHGFGALLADDMGLGKTIQTIAWMLDFRDSGNAKPILVVAPLTLLSNWRHEINRFAPSLSVYVHHGDNRHRSSGFARAVAESAVTLTSYTLLVKEHSQFAEVEWGALVLDEAQAAKNPDTQVSRSIRALSPKCRIALTGTPIENSVADIWALQEFLNPGFLGERKDFADRFVKPLVAGGNTSASARLHHALEPFVLRRLKSDPEIAAELGEKHEIKEYCELMPSQRAEYEAVLADYRVNERVRGDVFALITRLKLVCDSAEDANGRYSAEKSGKMQRLLELLEQIFANGESALVFSQYARVGQWIAEELKRQFARSFPFLHGGLSVRQRENAIKEFNDSNLPTAFVLSLKAGGFGLNLTKATHVIHFDRWWNPAVENQATDRAHRIGQDKTVFVHSFITVGTLEEHVDDILERKSLVAGSIITEMEWLQAANLEE